MRKRHHRNLVTIALVGLLAVLLVACESSYTTVGISTRSHQDMRGGDLTVKIKKANGSSTQDIEIGDSGLILDTDVTLTVGEGVFRLELLDGEGDVTLTLEARDGQTVSGSGRMVTDSFGDARYRVTAADARNVEYRFDYTFRQ
ncbi:MAG: hypothetical protein J7M16_02520 [Anaerolineae bacterium]|nr:hypothetical protein [Anaerolineae bacterium]